MTQQSGATAAGLRRHACARLRPSEPAAADVRRRPAPGAACRTPALPLRSGPVTGPDRRDRPVFVGCR